MNSLDSLEYRLYAVDVLIGKTTSEGAFPAKHQVTDLSLSISRKQQRPLPPGPCTSSRRGTSSCQGDQRAGPGHPAG
ncbi:hypothetical protein [Streptomyces sp. NRRL B-24572]|uniref:hypothetical protein n=1 Tax=Streptomyces sp. NRRL B-24572 TaxID=1962156 RepID=UPI00117E114C|nr:hypothetical protein [Streptomyces sp. NRRL B-24572]